MRHAAKIEHSLWMCSLRRGEERAGAEWKLPGISVQGGGQLTAKSQASRGLLARTSQDGS